MEGKDGQTAPPGFEELQSLWEHLKARGMIDAKGKVQNALKGTQGW